MPAEIPFPLTLEYVQSHPTSALIAGLQSWVRVSDPGCLVHPHGFYVVLLYRSELEDWRLHWWPKGPRILTGMPALIHTHDKLVDSRILAGELKNVLYDVTEVAAEGQPVYEVTYLGDKFVKTTNNVLQRTNQRLRAVVSVAKTLKAGDSYSIEPHVYHEAVVPNNIATATIVCMHSPSPGPVRVLGLDGYPEQIGFQRTERRAAECLDFVPPRDARQAKM